MRTRLTSIEICAGAGGQALGLEQAGFHHLALLELDRHACATLRTNRPYWNTIQDDVTHGARRDTAVRSISSPAACHARRSRRRGGSLGPMTSETCSRRRSVSIRECQPKAVMLENVRGLLDRVFDDYREDLDRQLREEGYDRSGSCTRRRTSASPSCGLARSSSL